MKTWNFITCGNVKEVYYTVDGEIPSKDAKLYTTPFKLTQNIVVKSAIFKNAKISSKVSEAYFGINRTIDPAPVIRKSPLSVVKRFVL